MSKRSLREIVDELRAIPAEWKKLDDPVSEIMKIRYGDDWGTCSRCVELAALEREIGRAVIGEAILDNIDAPFTDLRDCYHAIYTARYGAIARYRALHAAGAEAATGGEEAG